MTHFKARNLTALLLVLILLVSMFSTTALAAEDEYITDFEAESEIIIEEEPAVELPEAEESSEEVSEIEESSEVSDAPTSGTIPDSNIQWELTDDGMLLISGSGGCAAFSSAADQPWAAVREQITSVFFEDPSLLSIYDLAYWFDGCVSLTTAEIPYTTPVIGTHAFYGCVSLTTIMTYYGDSVLAEIGADAFYLPYDSGSTLYIGYLIGYPESTVPLHTYDWTGSNRSSLYFMDVYSTNALTSVVGACPSCGKQSLQGTYVAQSHTSRGHAEYYEAPVEEQNFATLIEMLNSMEVREDDEEFENAVDLMFKELAKEKPDHFAVRQYAKYRLAAGKTLKSILVSCGARLAPFDIEELREVTAYDELELDTLGDRKTALFLIMSDTDASFNFLISMIYSQLFNLLCEKADDVYGGRLPVHVRCLIDEAANIGQIPQLERLVATIRSREISACLILQAQSQLKALYKDNADTIIGNMDSRLFLGGSEPTTLKELSTALGKETIDTFNTGESRGRETSHSLNYQKLGKELASVDELAVLDGGKCILQLRGVRPFLSEKYDITKHPNYKYLSDADRRNTFDIEKFLSTKLKVKPEETYDSYEAAVTEELSSV